MVINMTRVIVVGESGWRSIQDQINSNLEAIEKRSGVIKDIKYTFDSKSGHHNAMIIFDTKEV